MQIKHRSGCLEKLWDLHLWKYSSSSRQSHEQPDVNLKFGPISVRGCSRSSSYFTEVCDQKAITESHRNWILYKEETHCSRSERSWSKPQSDLKNIIFKYFLFSAFYAIIFSSRSNPWATTKEERSTVIERWNLLKQNIPKIHYIYQHTSSPPVTIVL